MGGGPAKKSNANRMKQLIAQNKKHRRTIKSLKRTQRDDEDCAGNGGDGSGGSDTDAGDQFGGKHSKKKGKK